MIILDQIEKKLMEYEEEEAYHQGLHGHEEEDYGNPEDDFDH